MFVDNTISNRKTLNESYAATAAVGVCSRRPEILILNEVGSHTRLQDDHLGEKKLNVDVVFERDFSENIYDDAVVVGRLIIGC